MARPKAFGMQPPMHFTGARQYLAHIEVINYWPSNQIHRESAENSDNRELQILRTQEICN